MDTHDTLLTEFGVQSALPTVPSNATCFSSYLDFAAVWRCVVLIAPLLIRHTCHVIQPLSVLTVQVCLMCAALQELKIPAASQSIALQSTMISGTQKNAAVLHHRCMECSTLICIRCLICRDTEAIRLQGMHGLFGKAMKMTQGCTAYVSSRVLFCRRGQ